MTAWELRARAAMRRLRGVPAPEMVEIGFGAGRMSRELMRLSPVLVLHSVDNFLDASQQPPSYLATRDKFALRDSTTVTAHRALARSYVEEYAPRFLLHEMSSVEASRTFKDGSVDLVFIDGDHSYEGVREDIACWLPKVRKDGWLGGHDFSNPDPRFDFRGVDRAVLEFEANFNKQVRLDDNFTWWVQL